MGGRKLVGAVRVAGVVTKKPLGISLAPPTRGVGGFPFRPSGIIHLIVLSLDVRVAIVAQSNS